MQVEEILLTAVGRFQGILIARTIN